MLGIGSELAERTSGQIYLSMGENTWKLLLLGVESLWLPLSGPFLSFAQILSEITFLTLYWLVSGIPAHRIVAQGLSFVAYM